MGGQHGIENTGKVLDLLAEGGNVAEDMVKSKGGFISKITHLSALFDEVLALTSFNAGECGMELKELDDEDVAKLKERFKAKFDLDGEVLEAAIEEGLDLLQLYAEAVPKTIAWAKKLKGAPAAEPEAPSA